MKKLTDEEKKMIEEIEISVDYKLSDMEKMLCIIGFQIGKINQTDKIMKEYKEMINSR